MREGHGGTLGAGNVLFLDLGDHYMGVCFTIVMLNCSCTSFALFGMYAIFHDI